MSDISKSNFIAKYGADAHREKLSKHAYPYARAVAVKYSDKFHEKLADDESSHVREQVAYHTNSKPLLDHMLHRELNSSDPQTPVLAAIASHGHHDHADRLVHHHSKLVRMVIAQKGGDAHKHILTKDSDSDVREDVARNGNHEHRDALVNDPERHVRQAVAMYGTDRHHRIMMHDHAWQVRNRVALHTTDPSVLHHLKTDSDVTVRNNAATRLQEPRFRGF